MTPLLPSLPPSLLLFLFSPLLLSASSLPCLCSGDLPPTPITSSSTGVTLQTLSYHSEKGYSDIAVCNSPREGKKIRENQWENEEFPVVFSMGYNCSCGGGGFWRIQPGCEWFIDDFSDDYVTNWENCGEEKRGGGGKCRKVAKGGCGEGYEEGREEYDEEETGFEESCALECETTIKLGMCRTFRMYFPYGLKKGAMGVAIKSPYDVNAMLCTLGCFVGPTCESCVLEGR